MSKLLTPLMVGTTLAVTTLGITRLFLMPQEWMSSVAALLFLPLVIGTLLLRHRGGSDPAGATTVSGKLRAALVGAGVLFATALLESMLETLGAIPQREDGSSALFLVMLPALVAVGIDILSARLERRAEKETD